MKESGKKTCNTAKEKNHGQMAPIFMDSIRMERNKDKAFLNGPMDQVTRVNFIKMTFKPSIYPIIIRNIFIIT